MIDVTEIIAKDINDGYILSFTEKYSDGFRYDN